MMVKSFLREQETGGDTVLAPMREHESQRETTKRLG